MVSRKDTFDQTILSIRGCYGIHKLLLAQRGDCVHQISSKRKVRAITSLILQRDRQRAVTAAMEAHGSRHDFHHGKPIPDNGVRYVLCRPV